MLRNKFKHLDPIIELKIKANQTLKLLFHAPGEEIWLYSDYRVMDFIEVGGFEGGIDIAIAKTITTHHLKCDPKVSAYKHDGKECRNFGRNYLNFPVPL